MASNLYIFRNKFVLERKDMEMKGVGVMSVRKLAAERNEASFGRFVRRLNSIIREESRSEPMRGFDELCSRTETNLEKMRGKVREAKVFLATVEQRREGGLLDAPSAKAESLPCRTILAMASMLETAFREAKAADNTLPMKRVNIAIQVLSGAVSLSLITPVRYPESDDGLKESLMQSRLRQASSVHEDVCKALDGVEQALGLTLPGSPSLS